MFVVGGVFALALSAVLWYVVFTGCGSAEPEPLYLTAAAFWFFRVHCLTFSPNRFQALCV